MIRLVAFDALFFLLPFAVLGFLLCLRIWNAKPSGKPAH